MKAKLLLFLSILFLASANCLAQGRYRKPLRTSSQTKLGFSNYNIGLKLGCPWSYMTKSDLQKTSIDGHFGYLGGLSVERNLGKWSVALEGSFAQKGNRMHNEREYQISLTQKGLLKTTYSVAYNVVAIRVPVTYYFQGVVKEDMVIPYVFLGPEVDIALDTTVNAVIQKYDGPTGEHFFSETPTPFSPPPINISVVAGAGLMTKVRIENNALYFKLDVAYNRGLMNLNLPTQEGSQENQIFAHDVEINFSIVYPIKKILHDACYYF